MLFEACRKFARLKLNLAICVSTLETDRETSFKLPFIINKNLTHLTVSDGQADNPTKIIV